MKPVSEASGVRSSWLALARKSARVRSVRRSSVSSRRVSSASRRPLGAVAAAGRAPPDAVLHAAGLVGGLAGDAAEQGLVDRLQHLRVAHRGDQRAGLAAGAEELARRGVGVDQPAAGEVVGLVAGDHQHRVLERLEHRGEVAPSAAAAPDRSESAAAADRRPQPFARRSRSHSVRPPPTASTSAPATPAANGSAVRPATSATSAASAAVATASGAQANCGSVAIGGGSDWLDGHDGGRSDGRLRKGTDQLHFTRPCVVRVTVAGAPPCTLKAAALQS